MFASSARIGKGSHTPDTTCPSKCISTRAITYFLPRNCAAAFTKRKRREKKRVNPYFSYKTVSIRIESNRTSIKSVRMPTKPEAVIGGVPPYAPLSRASRSFFHVPPQEWIKEVQRSLS